MAISASGSLAYATIGGNAFYGLLQIMASIGNHWLVHRQKFGMQSPVMLQVLRYWSLASRTFSTVLFDFKIRFFTFEIVRQKVTNH
jgi:hypothetical protein